MSATTTPAIQVQAGTVYADNVFIGGIRRDATGQWKGISARTSQDRSHVAWGTRSEVIAFLVTRAAQ